jgi:Ring finger domain
VAESLNYTTGNFISAVHLAIGYLFLLWQPAENLLTYTPTIKSASLVLMYCLRYTLASVCLEEMMLIWFRKPDLSLVGTSPSTLDECMICMETGAVRRQFCSEDHVSHHDCMLKWVKVSKNYTCPMCRRKLKVAFV